MNDRTNRLASLVRLADADDGGPPPRDALDGLLRAWHDENADAARASRERTLRAIAADHGVAARPAPRAQLTLRAAGARTLMFLRSRSLRAAACIAAAALLATMLLIPTAGVANASVVQVADGGELTAYAADAERDRLGPCALEHTDVNAEVSGPITRVTVRQRYANHFQQKIEAVYTFPLSHRAAVDAMRIVVRGPDGSERVVDGEVRERGIARAMYEQAKAGGLVASLLEQERTNIFTQSVANIEPGASVTVEIRYVEFLERIEGEYRFAFPMVVAPRYIPGSPTVTQTDLPDGLRMRAGLVLLGPADVSIATPDAGLSDDALRTALAGAVAIATPSPEWMERPASGLGQPVIFGVTYANGARESGQFFVESRIGHLNGRWFVAQRLASGGGFAADTDRVPDASRITPMPVRPSERAGHDVSIAVTIDGGGVPIHDLTSELHEVSKRPGERPNTTQVALTAKTTIPNRDFVLSWRATPKAAEGAASVATGVLAHRRTANDETAGGYLAMVIEPPARAAEAEILDREIVFLVDTSGSMSGFPIEKSKELMNRALDAMRPGDTFNVITFAGSTTTLWPAPREASAANREAARAFVEARNGGGGTEMLAALRAALGSDAARRGLSLRELADLPADGRAVVVAVQPDAIDLPRGSIAEANGPTLRARFGVSMPTSGRRTLELAGRWITESGERLLVVDSARFEPEPSRRQRALVFLTDGLIGNDAEVIDFVRRASRSTRVFAFGIGNSVNRALIDGVAGAGRGAAEFVTLPASADAAIARLARRMSTPVLADIEVAFEGIDISDVYPPLDAIPDLLDERPLMLVGRFTQGASGFATIRGRTAAGPWERRMPIDLGRADGAHASVASLWARAKSDRLLAPYDTRVESLGALPRALRTDVIRLGERYGIMTPLTSFVAVERSRVTVGGAPMLVRIPVELPEGMSWKGLFGEGVGPAGIASRPDRADSERSRRRIAAVERLAERSVEREEESAKDAILLFFEQIEIAEDELALTRSDVQFPWQNGRGERDDLHREIAVGAEELAGVDFAISPEFNLSDALAPGQPGGFGGGGGGAPTTGGLDAEGRITMKITTGQAEKRAPGFADRPTASPSPVLAPKPLPATAADKPAAPPAPAMDAAPKARTNAPAPADRSAATPPAPVAPKADGDMGGRTQRIRLDDATRDMLARRLERLLIVIGLAAEIDVDSAAEIARTSEPPVEPDARGRVLVAIVVESSDPPVFAKSVAALRDAGVAVEATQPATRLIVARVAMTDLLRVALLPGLTRIESVRATAGRS